MIRRVLRLEMSTEALSGLAFRVVEVGDDSEDDTADSVAKIRPGGLFHFVQDHGRGFLVGNEEEVARRLLFGITAHEFLGLATVLHFDVGLATVVDNLEGEALNISPDPSERWYD